MHGGTHLGTRNPERGAQLRCHISTLFLSAGQNQDFPLIGVRFQTFWVVFLIIRESYLQRVCRRLPRKHSLEMGLGRIPSFLGMIPNPFGKNTFSRADNKVGADKVVFWYPNEGGSPLR